jgi:hypothetical protein
VTCDSLLAIDDPSARDAARALGLCGDATPSGFGVIDARFTRADGTVVPISQQVGTVDRFGPNVLPREGGALLALSTGRARTPGHPDACGEVSCTGNGPGTAPLGYPQIIPGCGTSSQIFDDVALALTLRAPANAAGFAFRFKFYSFEYPQYVCSAYNDQFVVLMQPPPLATQNGNVVFDSGGNPISVNSVLDVCSGCLLGTAELAGTGFDTWGSEPAGGTGWLRTVVPVVGGQEFTLRFIIWDTGDQNVDSTVLLDAFQWLLESTGGPSTGP